MTAPAPLFTLIDGGDVYAPEPLGRAAVLIAAERIVQVGSIERQAVERTGLGLVVIDAAGCIVVPGFVDPHEHLLGGSGEEGFASQTPEIAWSELMRAGVTTVVGCLGVDTTTKTMPGLLAKVRAFNDEGMTARLYSGGYDVPPVTLTGSVRDDMLLVPEVIGAGEIAIADRRSTAPSLAEIDRLVRDASVGGLLTGKCGVTHFHVGDEPEGLALLTALLDERHIDPSLVYPTHVARNEPLLAQAAAITRRGVAVDIDTVEHDLARTLGVFLERGGDLNRLTVSTDAAINSPSTMLEQVRDCVHRHGHSVERMWRIAAANAADVLKLPAKGRIAAGADADVLILTRDRLELRDVIARGSRTVANGAMTRTERFLRDSNRTVIIHGCRPH